MDRSLRDENVSEGPEAKLSVLDSHTSDFISPTMDVMKFLPYDLQLPAIDYRPNGDESLVPDVGEYAQLAGLDVVRTIDNATTDLGIPGGEASSQSSALRLVQQAFQRDPTLPVAEHQFGLEVRVAERPGDLASDALDMMHAESDYQESKNLPYEQSFQDQSGMNTRRRRHMDLLQHGLDEVG